MDVVKMETITGQIISLYISVYIYYKDFFANLDIKLAFEDAVTRILIF